MLCAGCEQSVKSVNTQARYCSPQCKDRAREMRRKVPCVQCGLPVFWPRRGDVSRSVKCQPCRREAHGTVASYANRGCRCVECRAAATAAMREYTAKVVARDGLSPTQKRRPLKVAVDCAACGLPLKNPAAPGVWHQECRPAKFYARPERRLAIYERDGWVCQLCGDPVDRALSHRDRMSATLDHIVPQSLGGGNESTNLRLAHLLCNSVRGNRVAA